MGYRQQNTILLTLIGIWFCLIMFGNSEGIDLLSQLKSRSKLKKSTSTILSSSLKGKDNAYLKAMLKTKQSTSHLAEEVEPQTEGHHDKHDHKDIAKEEEHLDHGGYNHKDNTEEEEEKKEHHGGYDHGDDTDEVDTADPNAIEKMVKVICSGNKRDLRLLLSKRKRKLLSLLRVGGLRANNMKKKRSSKQIMKQIRDKKTKDDNKKKKQIMKQIRDIVFSCIAIFSFDPFDHVPFPKHNDP